MIVIAILLAVGAGLLIGTRVTTAHDAHVRFSRYRTETNESFGAWFKSVVTAVVSIAIFVLIAYALVIR